MTVPVCEDSSSKMFMMVTSERQGWGTEERTGGRERRRKTMTSVLRQRLLVN